MMRPSTAPKCAGTPSGDPEGLLQGFGLRGSEFVAEPRRKQMNVVVEALVGERLVVRELAVAAIKIEPHVVILEANDKPAAAQEFQTRAEPSSRSPKLWSRTECELISPHCIRRTSTIPLS